MKKLSGTVLLVLFLALAPHASDAQQVDAPVYKDGEWWRVKVEVSFSPGTSRSGRCDEIFAEYLVKIDRGRPKVYGIKDTEHQALDCPDIASQLLGLGPGGQPSRVRYLNFPLSLGQSWTFQSSATISGPGRRSVRTYEIVSKVSSKEKVATPRGEFEAFKIERSGRPSQDIWRWTYYYSPAVKAIIRFEGSLSSELRTITLVDFSVNQ